MLLILLYVVSLYYIYTLLYIKKEQRKQSRERANERTEQEERTRAKDAAAIFASSSPLFCFVCCITIHTIASRSPLRQLVSTLRDRYGRPPRPLLGDVIATPRHHIASEQQPAATGQRLDGLPSCPPRPRPRSLPSGGEEGKSKGANETEREGTRAKDAAAIFASSSPLFCSV